MFKPFSFKVPGEIVFGTGCITKLSGVLKAKGINKVLLVSDRGIEAAGILQKLSGLLTESGLSFVSYLDIEANPSTETVDAGYQIYKEKEIEAIVCLGGGSPMDTAKGIAVLATNGGRIQDYEGGNKVKVPTLPLFAIPTTAGTGSEVTPFIVITDKSRNYKFNVISFQCVPLMAFLDPELISTLPPAVAASTGLDALIHAIEAYLSLKASPFSDAMAEKAMELIGKNIRLFVANRSDNEAAAGMLLGSAMAGIAFSWGNLGDVHAMAHPLGGFFGIAHGVANAVLLPTILEFNALADQGKYKKIFDLIKDGKAVNCFTPDVLVAEVKQLLHELSIPKNLTELGVTQDLIPQMAADAVKSGLNRINPRQTTVKDFEQLYLKAMV